MKVALIVGTGFVGSYITDELIPHDMIPRLLVRQGAESKLLQPERCELVFGDLSHDLRCALVPAFWKRCWVVMQSSIMSFVHPPLKVLPTKFAFSWGKTLY